MSFISKETATDIALAWREVEAAEGLLSDVRATLDRNTRGDTDIRDVFGRRQHDLQLGVPSGETGHRLFGVQFSLAVPIIEAHISNQRARISALSAKAAAEIASAAE